MLVASFSKAGLDGLMRICFIYACIWRFLHAALKSAVVVLNEKRIEYLRAGRVWKLGNETVPEKDQYKHLGVICDKNLGLDDVIADACKKIKGTFLSIVNSGLHENGINPIMSLHIYNSVVLPKALHGCELWCNLTSNQNLSLERAHRFCLKFMQYLPRNTKTEVALTLLGSNSIEMEVDRRKLIFLEQLCNLPSHLHVKELFIHRLINYFENPRRQLGFIPDICRILEKYSLSYVLQGFLENGIFVSKYAWKRLLKEKMSSLDREELLRKATESTSLTRFLGIHNSSEPYMLYRISKETPKIYQYVKLSGRLLGFMFSGERRLFCRSCGMLTNKLTEHILLFCKENEFFRNKLWESLIHRFGVYFFNKLISLSPASQVDNLFSGCYDILHDENDTKHCLKLFVTSLSRLHFVQHIQLWQIFLI